MSDQNLDLERQCNFNVNQDEAQATVLTTMDGMDKHAPQAAPERQDSISNSSSQEQTDASDNKISGNENAFAQLVKGWESYISASGETRPFQPLQQPLQMFQNFGFRGQASHVNPPIPPGVSSGVPTYYTSFGAPTLRHTHSTPNQFTPSMVPFAELRDASQTKKEMPPPPVPLDPFQRSSSTPSAYQKHSVQLSSFAKSDSSAFSLAPQRLSYTGQIYNNPYSAFNPVKYYELALEDMERTSIEVTDMTQRLELNNDSMDVLDESDVVSSQLESVSESSASPGKRGAAFRAARFLSDVRVLRRKRRMRTGRENPAQPIEESTIIANEENQVTPMHLLKLEAAVTVVTQPDFQYSDLLAANCLTADNVTDSSEFIKPCDSNVSEIEECKEEHENGGHYLQLDSDVDDEDDLFRRIDSQLHVESPGTIPSPSYQNFIDEQPVSSIVGELQSADSNYVSAKPSIKFLDMQPGHSGLEEPFNTGTARSPSPTHMDYGEGASLTPRSQETFSISPGTTRSAGTGSSSGQTTHATSISSTGQQSGLSTISETDREVMETNKEAKRRRGLDGLRSLQKLENDATSYHSSSTQSTNPHGYLALGESPVTLREGANVPVERFFSNSPSLSGVHFSQVAPFTPTNTLSNSSRRNEVTNSPSATSETVSATNTSSSTYSDGEPPTFVSYIDSTLRSDLAAYRESAEIQSERSVEGDAREPSPAPGDVSCAFHDIFDEPKVARELRLRRLQKYGTRPMRSPRLAARPAKTPPPRQSISPMLQQPISPPRKIVDHPVASISRPHVRRSGISSIRNTPYTAQCNIPIRISERSEGISQPFLVGPNIDQTSDHTLVRTATYNERDIELIQTDSMDDKCVKIITPEKDD